MDGAQEKGQTFGRLQRWDQRKETLKQFGDSLRQSRDLLLPDDPCDPSNRVDMMRTLNITIVRKWNIFISCSGCTRDWNFLGTFVDVERVKRLMKSFYSV